ncbi:MAG TPA: VTT domain-containing protein [Gemmatimonadaceae bacterium]|nr:VTT domain-containing protein [Gemmatimonadaceae bacterium]
MSRQRARIEKPRPSDWLRLIIPAVVLAGVVAAAWRMGYFSLENPQRLSRTASRVAGTPWLGPIFVAVYTVFAAMAVPIAPMAYIGGAMFHLVKAWLYVWIASLAGGSAGYWLARSVWHAPAKRLLGRYEKKLNTVHTRNPFLGALRMQLLPIVPFGVFNYTAGVSDMPFLPFLAGTAIGVIPGTFATVFVGHEILTGLSGSDKRPVWIGLGIALALVALSFVPNIARAARRS